MPVLTEQERTEVWSWLMRNDAPTGALRKGQLRQMVDNLDDGFESVIPTINAGLSPEAQAESGALKSMALDAILERRRRRNA